MSQDTRTLEQGWDIADSALAVIVRTHPIMVAFYYALIGSWEQLEDP